MENQVLILDKERLSRKLQRMAYQIWENNSNEQQLYFIGIEGSGLIVAEELARLLEEISEITVQVVSLKMNKKHPMKEAAELSVHLNNKAVVLIDDVANSGKTLLYALKPILDFEPKKVLVAVLVDRKHKSFPITPDIVGHSIATTLQEHIEVVCEGKNITAVYLQ
jgi:pyrimidine operon attenuation protein/uracil phosphoribosyltransferase